MTGSQGSDKADKRFLAIDEAEIVHGPDVITEKVTDALKDADRFDLPQVKPPLSDALDRVARSGRTNEAAAGEPAGQDALAATGARVDETAGSADKLKPREQEP